MRFRFLSLACLIRMVTSFDPAWVQVPTAMARQAPPAPPTRDPHAAAYAAAKDLRVAPTPPGQNFRGLLIFKTPKTSGRQNASKCGEGYATSGPWTAVNIERKSITNRDLRKATARSLGPIERLCETSVAGTTMPL